MRERLLGYLLGALDPTEREQVEARVRRDPSLQDELELLVEELEPLRAADEPFVAPPGLAKRSLQTILERTPGGQPNASPLASVVPTTPGERRSLSRHWTLADLTVATGIVLAASLLLFPALQHSRVHARLAHCQDNLRQLGLALTQYSIQNHGYFPAIAVEKKEQTAGIYAVYLMEGRLLSDKTAIVCPDSKIAKHADWVDVPTWNQWIAAHGTKREHFQKRMGGSYGYNLGYRDKNSYHSVKNLGRSRFALMSDEPSTHLLGHQSANHYGYGQNVLYEDGHVEYLRTPQITTGGDHIFVNDQGIVAAGSHVNDAVIGSSDSSPRGLSAPSPVGNGKRAQK